MTQDQSNPPGPERASWPFGPKTLAWLREKIPQCYAAGKDVAKAEAHAERTRKIAGRTDK